MLRWAENYFNETNKVPTVRATVKKFNLTSEKFYRLFPEGIAELCKSIGAPLPENRMMHIAPPTPPVDLEAEFNQLVRAHEFECDKQAFQTVLKLYISESGELGEDGEKLATKLGLLDTLTEGIQNSSDLAKCGVILDKLVLKLQLLRTRKKLNEDIKHELSNLKEYSDYFKKINAVGKTWLDHAEHTQFLLGWIAEEIDSCDSAEDVNSFRKFFEETTFEVSKLIEGAKKRQLAKQKKQKQERLFAQAISKHKQLTKFFPLQKRQRIDRWFFKRLQDDPNFAEFYLSAPFY